MSSDTDAATAVVALFNRIYIGEYCGGAAAVLFIYDAFITLDREVAYFWTESIHGAALLFFANKWITMMCYVMGMVQFAYLPSDQRCSWFQLALQAVKILQVVPAAAFSALRAYVLSRSKLLGLLVLALSLAPVGANLVFYGLQISGVNFPPFGCLAADNVTAAFNIKLVYTARVPLIAADIILIYITWTKLRSWVALRDIRQSKRLSLSDILFRGGIIYFVILFFMNVLHLVMSAAAVASDGFGSYVTDFTAPITAILISRFLLALQETNRMVVRLDPNDPLYSSRSPYDSSPSSISSLGGFINPALLTELENDQGFELQVRTPSEAGEEAEGGVPAETAELTA